MVESIEATQSRLPVASASASIAVRPLSYVPSSPRCHPQKSVFYSVVEGTAVNSS